MGVVHSKGLFWTMSVLVPIVFLVAMWMWTYVQIEKKPGQGRRETFWQMGAALLFVIMPILFAILAVEKDVILKALTRWVGAYGMRSFVSAFIIGLGFLAHWWKRKNQRSYGSSEVLFGCIAVIFITLSMTPGQSVLSQWVGLGSAAYIIARGLNNVVEAREEQEMKLGKTA